MFCTEAICRKHASSATHQCHFPNMQSHETWIPPSQYQMLFKSQMKSFSRITIVTKVTSPMECSFLGKKRIFDFFVRVAAFVVAFVKLSTKDSPERPA